MKPRTRLAMLLGGVALAASALTLLAVHARAAGIPETDALTYTGYLESAEGAPLTGAHSIEVQFWESAEAADSLCSGNAPNTELQSGRFQVALPKSCADAVKASPDVWVDVSVDGASLGRTKIGAVPFALEAGHATTADSATDCDSAALAKAADGELRAELDALQAEVDDHATALEGVPAVAAWKAYSPVLRESDNSPNPVTPQTTTGAYRRVGDSIEVMIATTFTTVPTPTGGGYWVWELPAGLSFGASAAGYAVLGTAVVIDTTGNTVHHCSAIKAAGAVAVDCDGATGSLNGDFPYALGDGSSVRLHFTTPIDGWTTTP